MSNLLLTATSVLTTAFLGWQVAKFLLPWLPEDLDYLKRLNTFSKTIKTRLEKGMTLPESLRSFAEISPDKPCILYQDEVWTYKQMNEWANKATRALHQLGVKQGDQIALMMSNEPAYVAVLLASMRLGAEISLINYNLRLKVLVHSLKLSEAKLLILGGEEAFAKAVNEIRDEIDMVVIKYNGESGDRQSLKSIIDEQSPRHLEEDLRPRFPLSTTACYIYTSGTTGKPKAVKISHLKLAAGGQVPILCKYKKDDVMYCALPFYHVAGCMCGVATAIHCGLTLAVRKRFSASHFLSDCQKYNVTVVQYIGETLRYVCLQPPSPEDRNNKIRWTFGNGARPDVWRTFLRRFGPDIRMHEFYAATEGNVFLMNAHNKVGVIGTLSPLMKALSNISIVKYNYDTEEPYRDGSGRCVEVGFNEPGLILGKITQANRNGEYKGNKKMTDQKIVRNVFKEGDAYFNSGDLMMRDGNYGMHFCDRIGDTFRWKGENVSTTEVSDVIVTFPDVEEATVYGVEIKGREGRGGMAALLVAGERTLDLQAFCAHCSETLPKYAIPIFLRIRKSLEHTGTMKQIKMALRQGGYDLTRMNDDRLYFLDQNMKTYVPLDEDIVGRIDSGQIKL